MTDLEHYIYIAPKDKIIDILPNNYKDIYNNNKIFPDLDLIAANIINNNNQIVCDKGSYINKSRIKGISNISYKEYIEVIRKNINI